jgi:hypothetical protein
MVFSSSPTLSHSFFSLSLLQVVHLKLEENDFLLINEHQHLINVIGVSASGAVFLAAHNSSSISATSQNISEVLLKTIDEVGPFNVIQVITDNAANCKEQVK